jgi:hypothetical protein
MPDPEICTKPEANCPVVTGTKLCAAAAQPPPAVASSAVTGTDSTVLALACAKFTLTAA